VVITLLLIVGLTSITHGQAPRSDGHGRFKLDEFNRALGVECTHCHVADNWTAQEKLPLSVARNMTQMVALVNGKLLRGIGEVRCWTCHRGETRPARVPHEALDAQLAKWPADVADAPESTKLAMAVYSASTGLLCTQCHEKGDWKRVATDRMRLVPRMNAIFPAIEPFMPPQARTQCYMCHQGKQKPEKNP
jgi:hypothetical protein